MHRHCFGHLDQQRRPDSFWLECIDIATSTDTMCQRKVFVLNKSRKDSPFTFPNPTITLKVVAVHECYPIEQMPNRQVSPTHLRHRTLGQQHLYLVLSGRERLLSQLCITYPDEVAGCSLEG